jgi:hypothetical protein
MKATLITGLTILIFNLRAYCTNGNYQDTLVHYVKKTEVAYTQESFNNLAHMCERIISGNPKDWVPVYYATFAYIHLSFMEKNGDKKEKYCNVAQGYINNINVPKSEQSEVMVLQALLYFAIMDINPMARGPLYAPKAQESLAAAEKENANNPRIYYLKGKSLMYTPEFMGGGKLAAKPLFEKAVQFYKSFVVPENFNYPKALYPHWGMSDSVDMLKQCE